MRVTEIRKAETNEVSWWSKWVDETVWVTRDAYAMFSSRFRDEYFFNHGGFLRVEKDAGAVTGSIEEEFGKRGLPASCMFVQDGPSWKGLRGHLSSKGYKVADVMSVMEIVGKTNRKPVASNRDVKITILGSRSTAGELREWSGAYLRAFYGSEKLLDAVQETVGGIVKDKMTGLVLARIRKTPVGCAALYRTKDDMAGAYCVGTIPEFRERRVGATMLNCLLEIVRREKRKLILQTMRSDSAEDFYVKQGFKRAYSKSVFIRRLPGKKRRASSPPSEGSLGVGIDRSAASGTTNPFPEVFSGFGSVEAVRRIFGRDTEAILSGLKVSLDSPRGYMRVDGETGNIMINPKYLRTGQMNYLYLDVIHELVHVRQFREGKELYDMNYEYFERPTEIEAYEVVVEEAKKIGMRNDEIVEYLKVEWVTEEEFERFALLMGVTGD